MTTRHLIAGSFCLFLAAICSADPVATIKGTVTYSDGKPVEGAVVSYRYSTSPQKSYQTAKTDAQGRYELPKAAAEGFDAAPSAADPFASGATLQIESAPGVNKLTLPKPLDFDVKPGDVLTKDITLRRSLTLAGKVINETNGKPAPGISLFVSTNDENIGESMTLPGTVTTATDGSFKTEVPSGTRVQIMVAPLGAAFDDEANDNPFQMTPTTFETLTADKTDITIRVRLVETVPFTGKVVDAAGQPVSEAMVTATLTQMVQSGSDGAFTLNVPANRSVEISANSADRAGILTITPGQREGTITVRNKVDRSCVVSTPEGTPAGHLTFSYRPVMKGFGAYTMGGSATTDAQGKCTMAGVVPAFRYEIDWASGNEQNRDYDTGSATVDLTALKDDEPVRFTANQYTNALMGKVVDSAGKPVAGAKIYANHSPLVRADKKNTDPSATSAADGSFELGTLGGGVIDLLIAADGCRSSIFQTRTDNIDFVATLNKLDEKYARKVQVLGTDGNPLAGAQVRIASQGKPTQTLTTGASGNVDLPAGPGDAKVIIVCDAPGCAYGIDGFDGSIAGTLRVALQKPSDPWKVRLVDEQDKPMAGIAIHLLDLDQSSAGLLPNQSLNELLKQNLADAVPVGNWKTDASGVATVERLPANRTVRIAVQRPDGSEIKRWLTPQSAGRTVTIRFARPATFTGKLVDTDNKPVTALDQARIMLYSQEQYESPIASDGSFSITGIEPGTYRTHIFVAGGKDQWAIADDQQQTEFTPAQTRTMDVKVHRMLLIRGRFEGKTDDAEQVMIGATKAGRSQFGQVTADGTFEIAVSAPGEYTLQYQRLAGGTPQMMPAQTVKVIAGQNLEGVVVKARAAASKPAK